MELGEDRKILRAAKLSPWGILGAVTILAVIVVVLAIQNSNREKRYMAKILSEKGAALIRSFESGSRTGMMCMREDTSRIQTLLEDTARQPGILYLVITDPSGRILAHNDPSKIGQRFRDETSMRTLVVDRQERWHLAEDGQSGRAFEVYRSFEPLKGDAWSGWGQRCCPWGGGPARKAQVIFVGLDVAPFEDARKEDLRNTIIVSSVLLLLGVGGFLSLFWLQNFQTTRRLLQDTSVFASEVVASLPVGLIATGPDGKVTFFNQAAAEITRLSRDEIRGKSLDEVLPQQWCGLKDLLERRAAPVIEQEIECSFPGRNPVPLSVSGTRIRGEDGKFIGDVLILRNLSEVRRLEEEVRRREKLSALGSLAAGIAHEIRNPLSSIKGLATHFGGKFAEGSPDKEAAEVLVREADRLNRVISELLEFARPTDLKPKEADINEILEHSIGLVRQDARAKGIALEFHKGSGLPLAVVDPDRISQALLNLYLNALQAMDHGGRLSVRSEQESASSILIEVADTGPGIQQEVLGKIFDPYFTTKPGGTGLGLAIVHKILEAHGGTVRVRSAPGNGAVFSLRIPLNSKEGTA